MWVEAIFETGDVERMLGQLMPLTIQLSADGDVLSLFAPSEVAFVADVGLRVRCEASLRWQVLGLDVPVTIHDVRALLRPTVVRGPSGGDCLAFGVLIENLDVAGLPTLLDEHVADRVNEVLAARQNEMTLDLAALLGGSFELPAELRPLASISVNVAWAKLRLTDEALVLALSFHTEVSREAPAFPPAVQVTTEIVPRVAKPKPAAVPVALLAVLVSSTYAAFRLGARQRRRWL